MTTTPPFEERLGLSQAELLWSLNYNVFLERGYKLRDRYKPGVVDNFLQLFEQEAPVQEAEAIANEALVAGVFDPADHESLVPKGIDAVRISDGSQVWIKHYALSDSDNADLLPELVLNLELAKERRATNHCLPLLDHFTIQSKDALQYSDSQRHIFFVFPWAMRIYNHPWRLAAEALELTRQLIEGLVFLHERNIAHRDIHMDNLVMDPRPIFPEGIDPRCAYIGYINFEDPSKCLDRIEVPVRYYYIDLGLATRFTDRDHAVTWNAGLHTLPEVFGTTNPSIESLLHPPRVKYDAFAGDVWQLGITLHLLFGKSIPSICPLIRAMTNKQPENRPTAQQCLEQFHTLTDGLSRWELLWPVLDASHWREGKDRKRIVELDCLHFRDWARFVVKALRLGLCKPEQMKRLENA